MTTPQWLIDFQKDIAEVKPPKSFIAVIVPNREFTMLCRSKGGDWWTEHMTPVTEGEMRACEGAQFFHIVAKNEDEARLKAHSEFFMNDIIASNTVSRIFEQA